MSPEQLAQDMQDLRLKVNTIETKQKNDHGRIEDNKNLIRPLTTQLERLATNFENLIAQVKGSNERMDEIVKNTHSSLKDHGERLGGHDIALERQTVISDKLLKRMDAVEADVDELKTKGSKRWDGIMEGISGKIICMLLGGLGVLLLVAARYFIGA
ncbi:MAG: hypothetical protein FWB91_00010 [Defluviitaleaceae bacterium]|nr:hypothetical protein [Defluviitaleaceae bacterium]